MQRQSLLHLDLGIARQHMLLLHLLRMSLLVLLVLLLLHQLLQLLLLLYLLYCLRERGSADVAHVLTWAHLRAWCAHIVALHQPLLLTHLQLVLCHLLPHEVLLLLNEPGLRDLLSLWDASVDHAILHHGRIHMLLLELALLLSHHLGLHQMARTLWHICHARAIHHHSLVHMGCHHAWRWTGLAHARSMS